jgi:hypothetical protein
MRFMLRRSSLLEYVSVLHRTRLQCAEFFFYPAVCAAMFVKNPKYTFYPIKSSLTLAYYIFFIPSGLLLQKFGCAVIWNYYRL